MTQNKKMSQSSDGGTHSPHSGLGRQAPVTGYYQTTNQTTHYALLGLHPSASPVEIRRAYRELSKRYHPDTTDLASAIATAKFQQLNEAYATLSNPERRLNYDIKIGYSRLHVTQAPLDLNQPVSRSVTRQSSAAYLDPTDRPLSAGEIFVLFILGLTFLGCLLLAITIGLIRGEAAFQTTVVQPQSAVQEQVISQPQPVVPQTPVIPNLE